MVVLSTEERLATVLFFKLIPTCFVGFRFKERLSLYGDVSHPGFWATLIPVNAFWILTASHLDRFRSTLKAHRS